MVESEELKGLLMKVKEKSEKAMTNLDNILKSRDYFANKGSSS